ncbi:MAG: energy-coupling factor transporter transmembrane component T [Acutalibacteraceae bacterium]|nr:energy-coupling factor transporter transmembrane component T [Acutalibacteraceae bacterium]
MLNNITFGQYYPGNSVIHKLDPRFKIVLTFGLIIVAFVASNFISLGLVSIATVLIMLLSKIPLKMYFKTIKSIWFFIALTAVINIFFIQTGNVLVVFWKIKIYTGGVEKALFIALRIFLLLVISSALTYTTTPTSLTDAIESLLKPLSKIGINIHTFAMMMTIALRFIPTLIEETGKIMNAQKARGASMDDGSIVKRIKAVIPILIPLLASSIRRATELADAMECRCYHGGEGRTRLKVMKSTYMDLISLIAFACLIAGVVLINIFF